MQVQPYKSLGAKLFYLMSALVLLTIVGNSFQFFLQFKSYQTKQIQDLLQIQADRVKDQIESNIDMWKSQVTVALPTLRGADGKISQEALTRFINANQEFVALEIFTAESAQSSSLSPQGEVFTSQIGKANFEDKQPEKVWRVIKSSNREWLEKRIKASKKEGVRNIQLENISSKVDLQMLATAIRFDIDGSKTVVWAMLTTWQNNLTKLLPKSGTYNSGIVDPKGIIFSSPDPNDLAKLSKFSGRDMVQTAFQGKTPSGFLSNYRNQQGGERIGAYSRLSQFNLAVIVDQDAKAAMQIVEKTLVSTSLWA